MNLRSELEILMLCEPPVDLEDWYEQCGDFLRDHGPALLEAVVDAERYRWLHGQNALLLDEDSTETFCVVVDDEDGGTWVGTGLDAAIDAARGNA